MKRILVLIILSWIIQNSFGQACGMYRLKYIGEIKTDSIHIISVKLPTTMYLHGLEELSSDFAFIEVNLSDNKVEFEAYSHLTSVFTTSSENLLQIYKSKTNSIPIIITINNYGTPEELFIEISWKDITMNAIKDDKFGTLFELNLKDISII